MAATTNTENKSPMKGACAKIEMADNGGVVVESYNNDHGMGDRKTNVFKDLTSALKEIPAILSVAAQEKKEKEESHPEAVEDY